MVEQCRIAVFAALAGMPVLLAAAGPSTAMEEQALVKKLSERLVAPCCWHESVAVHRSPVADAMRVEIAEMVHQGMTEQQVEEHYVAEYGERILVVPRGRTATWLIAIPMVVLGLGSIVMIKHLATLRAHPPEVEAELKIQPAEVGESELDW